MEASSSADDHSSSSRVALRKINQSFTQHD